MKSIYALALAAAMGGLMYMQQETTLSSEANFTQFVSEFRKSYFNTEEYNFRLGVFQENMKKAELMNANPYDEAIYGMTQFADWTEEEFQAILTVNPEDLPTTDVEEESYEGAVLADSFDWRDNSKTVMTQVKDQGSCGSCWAFAANAAHESAWALKTGQLLDLSEQELVDCSTRYGNGGCGGGWYFYAWDYVKAKGGIS